MNTPQAIAEEADRLAREAQHQEAENLYKKLLSSNAEGEFRLRVLVKLAALYMSVVRRNDAIPVLEQVVRDYPDSPEAPKALYQIAQILWNRHDNGAGAGIFQSGHRSLSGQRLPDRAQYALGDIYEYFGKKDLAVQYYTSLSQTISQKHAAQRCPMASCLALLPRRRMATGLFHLRGPREPDR